MRESSSPSPNMINKQKFSQILGYANDIGVIGRTKLDVESIFLDIDKVVLSNGDTYPVQNKFYTPSSDGCGSLGLTIDTQYLPAKEMETCCNNHDICYDTCNSDKELCDLEFKRCLYKYCDSTDKTLLGSWLSKVAKLQQKSYSQGQ
uniref:Uncharacterized protein n=1 Tax=Megaselia scalaris TaxID=36166 RepID=T1GYA8_MEGSC